MRAGLRHELVWHWRLRGLGCSYGIYRRLSAAVDYFYSTIMSSDEGSRSPSSQVPLYLWGGCKVLAAPLTNDVPRVGPNDLDARIITFRPFYFSLDFTFPLLKFFRKVRCYKKYAQVRVYNAKLVDSLIQGDHAWHAYVLEVSRRWEGENDMNKKRDLESDMTKVRRGLNIPARFYEWCWLLSNYQKKADGLPPAKDIERWKQYGSDSDDQLVEREESSTELPEKRKADVRSSKDKAATLQARDVSPLRKKLRLSSAVIKSSSSRGLIY
ncbi:PREDICTED: LOC110760952 [Prunus dulcis]|uniref:PREDICTED: LOC110760952 n=1 Tax=Prunus dulcis TaxID=3755 RepID=A0A5E4FXZ7_PRUDU|nr:PREDICTED: LOC110760952 [Prunus dulcis]